MNARHDPRFAVAIIGGGFSGACVARHLLGLAGVRIDVALVDDAPILGRGLAYATACGDHLLNVPAGRLGIEPRDEGGFARWLASRQLPYSPSDFVPRRLFGAYMADELARAREDSPASWRHVRTRARRLRRDASGIFEIELADGGALLADRVVLATGHLAPPLPSFLGSARWGDVGLAPDPWRCDLARIGCSQDVLLVGSGLTAIDIASSLRGQGHVGPIRMLSRRGRLPHAHRENELQPSPRRITLDELAGDALRPLCAGLRWLVRRHEEAGGDWRDVMAGLRPLTPTLWQQLDERHRRQFLRHLLPFWDTHRHRVAPDVRRRLNAWLDGGELSLHAGRLVRVDVRTDGRLEVTWRARGSMATSSLVVDHIVNCTGTSADLTQDAGPLMAAMLDDGLLSPDVSGQGLRVDERLRVVSRDGSPVPGLHYVGPLLKARLWEAVAVPELRAHALAVARDLLAEIP